VNKKYAYRKQLKQLLAAPLRLRPAPILINNNSLLL
jgi:hypothetical protein